MKILEQKKKFGKKNHEHMEIHGFWRLEVHIRGKDTFIFAHKPKHKQQNKNVDEYVFDTSYSC